MHVHEVVDGPLLALMILVRIGADNRIAVLHGIVFHSIEHGSIIVSHQVRQDHADDARSLASQTLGEGVGSIVQFFGQSLHSLLHLVADFMRIAQGSRNGGNAHTDSVGQIFQ